MAAIAVSVALASVVGLVIGRPSTGHRQPAVENSSGPRRANLARLPSPAGVPGAIADPGLVATDPRVIHFDVNALASAAWRVTWSSTGSYESADVERDDFQAYAAVARVRTAVPPANSFSAREKGRGGGQTTWSTPSAVDIGGVTGTYTVGTPHLRAGRPGRADIRIWSLIWQPTPGLWAVVEVQTTSLEHALAAAGLVRFDRATRCALPFRIGSPPPGAGMLSCSVSLADGRATGAGAAGGFAEAELTYGDGARSLRILVMEDSDGAGDYPRDLRAGPYRVDADPDGRTYTMLVKPLYFTAVNQAKSPRYSRAQVLDVLGSMRPVGTPAKPETFD